MMDLRERRHQVLHIPQPSRTRADLSRRHSADDRPRFDVACHDRPRRSHRSLPDSDSREDRRSCGDPGIRFDDNRPIDRAEILVGQIMGSSNQERIARDVDVVTDFQATQVSDADLRAMDYSEVRGGKTRAKRD